MRLCYDHHGGVLGDGSASYIGDCSTPGVLVSLGRSTTSRRSWKSLLQCKMYYVLYHSNQ